MTKATYCARAPTLKTAEMAYALKPKRPNATPMAVKKRTAFTGVYVVLLMRLQYLAPMMAPSRE